MNRLLPGNQLWCPYTGSVLPIGNCSPEHIIPLALGGCDELTIPVDRSMNTLLGRKVDGVLANELGIQIRRREFAVKGHSGKIPQPTARVASYGVDGRPAQIQFNGKNPLKVWDARERRVLGEQEAVGQSLRFQLHLNMIVRVRFVAKVLLSAGYSVYGECFRHHADHDAARRFMNVSSFSDLELALDQCMARGNWELIPKQAWWDIDDSVNQELCKRTEGATIIMVPGDDGMLLVTVGILGTWIGSMTIPVDVDELPLDGEHDLGHVTTVIRGRVQRYPYRQYVALSFPEEVDRLALPASIDIEPKGQ
ncbi:hypothetical protein [Achromobacter sp. Marseille-Q4954]|uniref:hypothetical protein n=1 Tax=Achromobacter sp. Marseille-Q4954 TaxID=2942203 RepID=UPI002074736B|nr:hypothetical protein [Achromobacter sp. Marseille-Q4954]